MDELRRTAAGLARQPSEEPALCDWYVAIDDEPTGPLTKEQVRGFITNGGVDAESLVWREGYDDWLPLGTSPELRDLLRAPQVYSAVSAPSPRDGYAPQPPQAPQARAPQSPPSALRGQHVGRLGGPAPAPPQSPPYEPGPGYREREQYQPRYESPPQQAPQAPAARRYGSVPAPSFGSPPAAAPLGTPPSEIPRPPSSGEFVVPQIPPEPPVELAAPSQLLPGASPPPSPQASGAIGEGPSMAQAIEPPELEEEEETVKEPALAMVEPTAPPSPPIPSGPEMNELAGALFVADSTDDGDVPALAPMHEINKGRRQLAYIIAGIGAIIIGVIGAIILIQTGSGGETGTAHASGDQPSRVGVRLGGDPLVLPMGNTPEEETPEDRGGDEVEDEGDQGANGSKVENRGGIGSRGKNGKVKRLTEAERRMLEKAKAMGSDGTSPVNRKNGDSAGSGSSKRGQSLASDQIRNTISRNRTSIQRCYEREMRGSSSAGDLRVVLRITVQPSGVVSSSRVTTSRIRGTALATCMESASRRWRFPSATASSTFDAPFVLTPGRGR